MTFEEYLFQNMDAIRASIANDAIMTAHNNFPLPVSEEALALMVQISTSASIHVARLYDQWQSGQHE